MARTIVIDTIETSGRTFSINEKLIVIKGKYNAAINFYRSALNSEDNFGVKDSGYSGEFGFDRFNEDVMGEGLIEHYETLASVKTKKEPIEGNHSYFCSYLSIWPPNVNGNKGLITPKHIVEIFVKAVESDAKKEPSDINTEQVEFESSDPGSISINGSGVKKLSLTIGATAQAIKINCLKPFDSEIAITAKAQGKIIGKLIVYPNATRYKTVIQPVQLNFNNVEGTTVSKIPHTPFFTNLVQDFNTKAFNQAYIHAELAPKTHVIELEKNQFFNPKMLSPKIDPKTGKSDIYLKKTSESDSDTSEYNRLVENRYAAILAGQASQNKVEEILKEKIQNLLIAFDKHFKFTGTGVKYTERQHKKKIATTAWNKPDVQEAKADYDIALAAYKNGGKTSGLNKEHTIHLFFSHDIYAAKDPLQKVLAYSNRGSGVVHIFEAGLTDKAANQAILHEIGHSLGLKHTFDKSLGEYIVREPGKIYKEDLEEEIDKLESDLKSKEGHRKILKQGEVISTLSLLYEQIEEALKTKSWFQNNVENLKIHFMDKVKEAESYESKLPLGNSGSPSISKLEIQIEKIKKSIEAKKIQKKSAAKRNEFPNYKDQSKTDENYMDYNQDTSRNKNKNMQRKVFYKWQWDIIRKTGSDKLYLQKEN